MVLSDTEFSKDDLIEDELELSGVYKLNIDGKIIPVIYIGSETWRSGNQVKYFEEFGGRDGTDLEIFSILQDLLKKDKERNIFLDNVEYRRTILNPKNRNPQNKIILRSLDFLLNRKVGEPRKV